MLEKESGMKGMFWWLSFFKESDSEEVVFEGI